MRRAHHRLPFRRIHLVRADDGAHLIIQNLSCCARQGAKPGIAQAREIIGKRKPECARPLVNFQRGKGMDMHPRQGLLDGAANCFIGCAGIIRVDAALQANLGRAARPGFPGATNDFRMVKIIGRAAQGLMRLALAEGAKAAAIGADIGVVDVAIDHITHGITRDSLAERISSAHDMRLICIARGKQSFYRRRIKPFALRGVFDQAHQPRIRRRQ